MADRQPAARYNQGMSRRDHWERVYTSGTPDSGSWFQPEPTVSAELLERSGLLPGT